MTEREAFEAWLADDMHRAGLPLETAKRRAADSQGRDWAAWQASRRQALEDAKRVCGNHIPLGCSTSMVDVSRSQGVRACIDAIRFLIRTEDNNAPTPTKGTP